MYDEIRLYVLFTLTDFLKALERAHQQRVKRSRPSVRSAHVIYRTF